MLWALALRENYLALYLYDLGEHRKKFAGLSSDKAVSAFPGSRNCHSLRQPWFSSRELVVRHPGWP
jgi:hypothetical protein